MKADNIKTMTHSLLVMVVIFCIVVLSNRNAALIKANATVAFVAQRVGSAELESPREGNVLPVPRAQLSFDDRFKTESLESLIKLLSTMELDDNFRKLSELWMTRAARENPDLAYQFLIQRSGTHLGETALGVKLAEKFATQLDPAVVYGYIARVDNGQLSDAEISGMKRCAYINLAKRDATEALFLSIADDQLSKEERKAAMGEVSVFLPHTKATADVLAEMPDQSVTGGALGTTMAYWAEKDPLAAATWLQQHLDNPNQERLARPIVQRWVKKDLAAAATWVNSLPAGEAKDTGVIYVAQATVPLDPEAGLQWAQQIKHTNWRDTLSNQAKALIKKKQETPQAQ